jgi:hypothetical protein
LFNDRRSCKRLAERLGGAPILLERSGERLSYQLPIFLGLTERGITNEGVPQEFARPLVLLNRGAQSLLEILHVSPVLLKNARASESTRQGLSIQRLRHDP